MTYWSGITPPPGPIAWTDMTLSLESKKMTKLIAHAYRVALGKDITNLMQNELRDRGTSESNMIMAWFGGTGSGKSFSLIFTAERLLYLSNSKKKLDISHVFFSIDDLLDFMPKTESGDILILDEQIALYGVGSKRAKQQLADIEETVRQEKIYLFFSSPKLVPHTSHFNIETWRKGTYPSWDWSKPLIAQWKYTENLIFDDKENLLGYYITEAPHNKEFLAAYKEKKTQFIKKVKGGATSVRHLALKKMAEEILNNEEYLKELFLSPNLSTERDTIIEALHGKNLVISEIDTIIGRVKREVVKDRTLKAKVMRLYEEYGIRKRILY